MKSPTQQAIIFLLEEYIKDNSIFPNQYGEDVIHLTPEVIKAGELLEEIKGEDIHNDPELEGRI